ncbi:Type I phosphodiesterase / nucleotide pyrophosphatase [Microbacterium sp. ru370.1]|uniref:alkaline phosphatase family protein n=1 Tax=unclassified Microbacterium TaxID=2609290 RepID=UPI00088283F6|nr:MULTISPECIES: nucleotide pyrophosphatase/phosphodiesterase family protein [unclassified Microbacterium]SDO76332.1 Type I phosphodiesterase / nucleotide pyrophosphatase [Microbacterium sp. ru370.1]SIT88542.1 Type I phosphodiesterase / nucleotide pyrophosphatase [Microbacterium sp. RU1D]
MSLSLPADPPRSRSLTGVVEQSIAALTGSSDWFAPAQSAIVFLVDGLGAHNLAARRGHARFLGAVGGRRDVARTVFPSTTAAALTSLLTGTAPGAHGIVGYRARIPGTDLAPDQLHGWETDGLDPHRWQRRTPLFETHAASGRDAFVVSRASYTGTGFTEATLRGAEFFPSDDLDERVRLAADLAARHPGSITYLYAPELDTAGHRDGWESDRWTDALERVDAAARRLAETIGPRTGVVVTADHGMVDVPAHKHVLLRDGDPLLDDVALIGGEPRMLHLYAHEGRADAMASRWKNDEAARAWVLTRDEAVAAGLFGPVDDEVRDRIGDVVVAARGRFAYYDDREPDKRPQRMVGQHGSLTDEERTVPLLRLGAFS